MHVTPFPGLDSLPIYVLDDHLLGLVLFDVGRGVQNLPKTYRYLGQLCFSWPSLVKHLRLPVLAYPAQPSLDHTLIFLLYILSFIL